MPGAPLFEIHGNIVRKLTILKLFPSVLNSGAP